MKHSVIFSLLLLSGIANALAAPPDLMQQNISVSVQEDREGTTAAVDTKPLNSDNHANDIAILEDADGAIVLTNEPCVFNEVIKAKTANLPQENIYRVYATSKEGTQQGCWLMFNPPERDGMQAIHTVNLFTESGYVISYTVDRFQSLKEEKQASFHF